jgi:hypothetical protein
VELRRPLLNLALLEALECGILVRTWKQTIGGTATMDTSRRDMLLASLLATLPAMVVSEAVASPIDPAQTIIQPPADYHWVSNKNYPEHSVDMCLLAGSLTLPGLYLTLVRWWPGYMSAPHTYVTDRLCVVVSGTWWCNSGDDFDPASCVPVPAGSFVRRVAGTPHYDGVIRNHAEPAIIAICGMGPVGYKLVDPSKPGWRSV